MASPLPLPRARTEVAPGAVHVPGWLTLDEQRALVAAAREWAKPPAGLHVVKVRGGEMSVRIVCLGWHWSPYRYTREAIDDDGAPVKPFPSWLGDLARRAVVDAYGDPSAATGYEPDVALVNHYGPGAKMGMHQDKDEVSDAPVVSLSVGDRARFRFGHAEGRGRPWTDVDLESGDLVVFGRAARFAYHGVPKVWPGTAPEGCGFDAGRLNVTIRQTGLT